VPHGRGAAHSRVNHKSAVICQSFVRKLAALGKAEKRCMIGKSDGLSQQKRYKAVLTALDGVEKRVILLISAHKSVRDGLADASPFLEMETAGGHRGFIAKTALAKIVFEGEADASVDKYEKSGATGSSAGRFDSPDPYIVLGVGEGASEEAVKSAYHDLVRTYHPDRIAGLGIPREFASFASYLLAQINSAFDTIEQKRKNK
jgi:DnaJ domain